MNQRKPVKGERYVMVKTDIMEIEGRKVRTNKETKAWEDEKMTREVPLEADALDVQPTNTAWISWFSPTKLRFETMYTFANLWKVQVKLPVLIVLPQLTIGSPTCLLTYKLIEPLDWL